MQGTELAGTVALVTGAARNIGRAIALELASAGAAVMINAKSAQAEADSVVAQIASSGGQAAAFLADVTDAAAVTRLVGETIRRFGRLDILVNNAALRDEMSFETMTYAHWRAVLDVVLDGAFLCAQTALPFLRANASGSIVNVGGLTGHTGAKNRAHVVTAKAGIAGFTRALAHELSPEGITVNCVVPGMIDTVRSGELPGHRAVRSTLIGRNGAPEEVAATVRWLVGPTARFITGQTIHINGGTYLS